MTAASGQQALANGRQVKSGYSGMCQKYVRDPCWRVPSLYGSAIEAWNGARHKHPGDRTPPLGAPCYFRGGNYGHAVISAGGGQVQIRSTDCTSAGDISEVALNWVEVHWGYEYLGWTEDLNGVLLPLGGDEDMALSEDDLSAIANRVNKVLGDFNSKGQPEDDKDGDYADQRLRQIENKLQQVLDRL